MPKVCICKPVTCKSSKTVWINRACLMLMNRVLSNECQIVSRVPHGSDFCWVLTNLAGNRGIIGRWGHAPWRMLGWWWWEKKRRGIFGGSQNRPGSTVVSMQLRADLLSLGLLLLKSFWQKKSNIMIAHLIPPVKFVTKIYFWAWRVYKE